MIQICTCFKFSFRTGSLEDICCDDRCCGCWCHGDMNQDTSIHRADSDAHCIHPTSQMIIDNSSKNGVPCCLNKYDNTDSGNGLVLVWRQSHARTNISCPQFHRSMTRPDGWLCASVCVCLYILWISLFFPFFFFLIWYSIHCYVQLCMYWCFFVQLLWWSCK